MSGQLKLHRGATTSSPTSPTSAAYVGPIGELIVDTDGFGHGGPLLRVQDGTTAGGWTINGTGVGSGAVRTVTATATLNTGDFIVFVNLSATGQVISLPASPGDGERHKIKDIAPNFATNNCTISGNGHNIITSVAVPNATMDINGQSWELIFSATANVWGVF